MSFFGLSHVSVQLTKTKTQGNVVGSWKGWGSWAADAVKKKLKLL